MPSRRASSTALSFFLLASALRAEEESFIVIFAPAPGFAVLLAVAIVADFLRPGRRAARSFRLSLQLAGAAAGQHTSTFNEPARETE